MADSVEPQDLSVVGLAYARAFTDDLRALVGADIALNSPEIETVAAGTVVECGVPMARTTCANKEEEGQTYFCLVSRRVAVTLACMLMGHPEERVKEMREQPLDEEMLDAFGEVMNLGTAVLSRMFTDQYGLPPVGVESTIEVESPGADEPWLDADEYVIARYAIAIPGYEDGSLTMVFPPDVANAWFGIQIGRFGKSGDATAGDEDRDENTIEPTSIVFIEPDEELRNEIEDMEESLIHSIWTIDPEEFDPDELEEFAEVGAFFIEWDLAIRTGLDFVECLRGEELTENTPVVMMCATPTDFKVRTAIRSGANSFVSKPLDLAELHARLDPLLLARQRARA